MATTHLPVVGGHPSGPAKTLRTDGWVTGPLATFGFLSFAIFYLTWAAFQGDHYWVGSYLSPLYSPLLFTASGVPESTPVVVLKLTPPGSVPVMLNVGAGKPVASTVKLPAVPTTNVVLLALVMAGGWLIVSVKGFWTASGGVSLLAVKVKT